MMGLKCELEIPTKVSKTQAPSTILNLMAHRPHLASSLNMFYMAEVVLKKNRNQYFI